MNESITFRHIEQQPQPGEFWLITITLDTEQNSTPSFLSQNYYLEKYPNHRLTLFSLQKNTLQLLSQAPFPENLLNRAHAQTRLIAEAPYEFSAKQIAASQHKPTLILGSDLSIGPQLYLSRIRKNSPAETLALLHASERFPFTVKPARHIASPGLPQEAIGACPLLEDWKIPNRLASTHSLPGCYQGSLESLLQVWIESENQRRLEQNAQKTVKPHWQVISCAIENQAIQDLIQNTAWLESAD